MPKVKGPLFSISAWKALGKALIYQRNKQGHSVYKYHKPGSVKPFTPSENQNTIRAAYNSILALWQALSDNDKESYNETAKDLPTPMSGWNYFYKLKFPLYYPVPVANTYSTDLEVISSQYWSITDGDQTGLDITGDMSIEAWVKFESFTNDSRIVTKVVVAGNQLAYDFYISIPGKFVFQYSQDGGIANRTLTDSDDDGLFNLNQWYHVAVTVDVSAKVIKFYLNGVLINNTNLISAAASIKNTTAPVEIGGLSTESLFLDGKLDEVRIWNKIRTQQEIQDNMSKELVGDEVGLAGYWRFNNDGLDQTANDNDLTNNNGATFSTDVPF